MLKQTVSGQPCSALLMLKTLLLPALVPLTASLASATQFTSNDSCNFTFSLGELPEFRLPEAGPNSPGDVQLNVGNNIITRGWVEGQSEAQPREHGVRTKNIVNKREWCSALQKQRQQAPGNMNLFLFSPCHKVTILLFSCLSA